MGSIHISDFVLTNTSPFPSTRDTLRFKFITKSPSRLQIYPHHLFVQYANDSSETLPLILDHSDIQNLTILPHPSLHVLKAIHDCQKGRSPVSSSVY